MPAPRPVSTVYITDASEKLHLAIEILSVLHPEEMAPKVVEMMEATHTVLLDLVKWAREVNNALATVDTVAVGEGYLD